MESSIDGLKWAIVDAINDGYGRWVSDFRVLDKRNNIYYLAISASSTSPHMETIQYFIEPDHLEPFMEGINQNLQQQQQIKNPPYIRDIRVSDLTQEDALAMTRDPQFLNLTRDPIEEQFADWDTGVHKLITIEFEREDNSKKRKRNENYNYSLKMPRILGGRKRMTKRRRAKGKVGQRTKSMRRKSNRKTKNYKKTKNNRKTR